MEEYNPKVIIVGCGAVGMSFAYALMISGFVRQIILIDRDERRAEGEAMDLSHGLPFVRPVLIRSGSYEDCKNADIIVLSAGARQVPGETRLELVNRNADIFKQIIPEILKYTREAILLVVSNPVDILSYVTYRLSGLPSKQVIGSGTVLDSARFRYLLSNHCKVDPRNVHAYIVGEHGDSEAPLWSLANIGGMRLNDYCPVCGNNCGKAELDKIFEEVRDAAYKVIDRKQATYYAIGLALVRIVEAMIRNENAVLPVSSLIDGFLGIRNVYLSLPAVVNKDGVERLIKLLLSKEEEGALKKSADELKKIIGQIKI